MPAHWKRKAAKHAFEIRLGKMLQSEPLSEGDIEIPYLKAQHVQWSGVMVNDMPTMWACRRELSRFGVSNGDLLVCEGGDVGRAAILEGIEQPAIIQNALHRVRSTGAADSRFLRYVLAHASSKGWFEILCNRATIAHLTSDKFGALDIPFPPPDEQRSIAAFLDRETVRIDALIEKKRRLIELLQEKRAAVITQATTRGLALDADSVESGVPWLGRIPKGWGVMSLARLTTKLTNGYVGPTRDLFVDVGIPYLQSLHIKQNRIQFGDDYFVTPEWSRRHAKSILHEGDVLVVQTGDIGQVAHVPKEWAGANCHALIVCSPDPQYIEGQYLAWLLTSAFGEASLLSCQTGALHPHLNCGVIKHMLLPVPPLDEQRSIVRHVTHTVDRIRELETKTESAIRLLAERRAALITAAVTGQIDVREAA